MSELPWWYKIIDVIVCLLIILLVVFICSKFGISLTIRDDKQYEAMVNARD